MSAHIGEIQNIPSAGTGVTEWFSGYNSGSGWNNTSYFLPSNNAKAAEATRADLRQMSMQMQAQGFNSAEAQKARDWEERMSNTAFQRKVADLQAAGFSPLAALGGASGASTPSAAVASSSPGSSHSSSPKGGEGMLRMLGSLVSAVVTKGMTNAMVAQAMQDKAKAAMDVAQAKIASSEKIAAQRLTENIKNDVGRSAAQAVSKSLDKSSYSAEFLAKRQYLANHPASSYYTQDAKEEMRRYREFFKDRYGY